MRNNHSIDTSIQIGSMYFSNRDDYKKYFSKKGTFSNDKDVWDNDNLIIAAQQHWHTRGQNGCVFAQIAATHAEKYGWYVRVLRDKDYVSEGVGREVDRIFEMAVEDKSWENLSLLFPNVDTPSQLIGLLRDIEADSSLIKLKEYEYEDYKVLALRGKIGTDGVLSWIVGFGSFDFLPRTRQSPFTELAIRTKKKPEILYEKLNRDGDKAHLADLPLGLRKHIMDQLWDRTIARTRDILGNSSRELSSARVTYAIPRVYYENG